MRKKLCFILVTMVGLFLVACSSDESAESSDAAVGEMTEEVAMEEEKNSFGGVDKAEGNAGNENNQDESQDTEDAQEVERKIIYTANLDIEVKDFDRALSDIQLQVTDFGGYVVESNMYGGGEGSSKSGHITVRVPQDSFQTFIQLVEDGSSEVIESSVSGQDVTEEFVDLESRLKSKRVVEERLLSFMEKAEKTEDLLAISNDLSQVQGEIEQIIGRMNYLQNKADLATVTISLHENNVSITGINDEELNTWEKTQQQILKSINFLIATFSGLFVFLIGNLPVFILFAVLGVIAFIIVRKRRKGEK